MMGFRIMGLRENLSFQGVAFVASIILSYVFLGEVLSSIWLGIATTIFMIAWYQVNKHIWRRRQ